MFGGFPFEEFAGGGRRGPKEPVDNEKFYKLLGVDKNASEDQIKKAFRKLAMTHHPDKGGDAEKFKEIQKAYEILSDKEKRQLYDEYGEEAATQGGGGGGPNSASDILAEMFGMGGGRRGPSGPRRGQDTIFPLKVDLADLYNGATRKLKLTRKVICKTCDGRGGKSGAVQSCSTCKGRGIRQIIRQIGPGMIQQMQTACGDCQGEGTIVNEKDKCADCKGNKLVSVEKIIEVSIERGMKHNERIKFNGEGDEAPNTISGDVIVVLQQKEHPYFKRNDINLIMTKHITLLEALAGFEFTVKHLDGRVLRVKSEKGKVYVPGDVKGVREEGMPRHRRPFEKGILFIELIIDFPKPGQLKESELKLLGKILPGSAVDKDKMDLDSADAEQVNLVDVDMKEELRRHREQDEESGEAYHEDEDGGHQHGPQCRAQ